MIELIETYNINIFDRFLIKPLKYPSYLVKYDCVHMEYKFSIPIFMFHSMFYQSQLVMYLFNFLYKISKV